MKALKIIGIILAVIIGLPLIIALFVSNDFSYEQSITINAPIEQVWASTNSLEKMDEWSPWTAKDPDLEQSFTGTSGAVGSENCWDSQHPEVGAGCQTITKVEAPTLLESHLSFSRPNESEGDAYVKLAEKNGATEVTWGMVSELPYPFNLINLVMDAEAAMSGEFNKGLNRLKEIAEA